MAGGDAGAGAGADGPPPAAEGASAAPGAERSRAAATRAPPKRSNSFTERKRKGGACPPVLAVPGDAGLFDGLGGDAADGSGAGRSAAGMRAAQPFSLSESGTFCEGDLLIGRFGASFGTTFAPSPPPGGGAGGGEALAGSPAFAGGRPASQQQSRPSSMGSTRSAREGSMTPNAVATGAGAGSVGTAGTPDGGAFDVALDDLETLCLLGSGVSGVVQKVRHRPTGTVLALKSVQMNVEETTRKQIIQELRTLYSTFCRQIVGCRGAFYSDGKVSIVLEHMDAGSLADLASVGPAPERVLARIARQVLLGLRHLHKELGVLHRDIKPSNLLVSTCGEVKISDFGVAGQLGSSQAMAKSWVGTVTYMSPERIAGKPYGFDSDIWSLVLCLMELALGRFPYPPAKVARGLVREPHAGAGGDAGAHARAAVGGASAAPLGFWDLMDFIVEKPAPRLDPALFSPHFCDFVARGLHKDSGARMDVEDALAHPWLAAVAGEADEGAEAVAEWVGEVLSSAVSARALADADAVAAARQALDAVTMCQPRAPSPPRAGEAPPGDARLRALRASAAAQLDELHEGAAGRRARGGQ